MGDWIIKLEDVSAGYGKLQTLFDVSLEIPRGLITVIVGPNGAGKSTLLKTMFGFTTVYKGRVLFENTDVTHMPPHDRAKIGMTFIFQLENIFRELTVYENLRLAGYDLPEDVFRDRLEEVFSMFPRLKERLGQKAGTLSGGERQMLAMAIGIMRKPKVFLIDEPTAGLSPKLAKEVLSYVRILNKEGYTVVLVEQNVKASLEIGDKGVLVVNGRIAFDGPAEELLARKDLAKMYLGV
ncbi:branched-chain amino acid ABC transporter, ATP binding protein [Aeropyrum pernix K1]|uniref:Branched-chain amino acid ABC transporter, ATP binding protein n=1 Tax=Aeropyrum pernix (strain ATCC 700893 / DSM 11879 / JCM 9820 / NBRC 100138 / K1) TaxID=272557 RepID=Q9YDJ2_AERPE|nr:ABC transporter ATP-binding protein [Aeropyrum pernix]BAA79905.1 branched-chain amino acid ABC transporter, ATP binding protein [Aeropyrum pernix K1]